MTPTAVATQALPNDWPMCRRSGRGWLTAGATGAVGTIGLLGSLNAGL